MMCAIMKRLSRINTAPRHRPVFDLRMPVLFLAAALLSAGMRESDSIDFNSLLAQPLFTSFANLLQNRRRATRLSKARLPARRRLRYRDHATPVIRRSAHSASLQGLLPNCPRFYLLLQSVHHN